MKELEHYFSRLCDFLKTSKIYVVGGLIRDILIKREKNVLDCDLIVEKDVVNISSQFAEKIDGSWFMLDAENQVYRVVKKDEKKIQFDFSLIKKGGIISDLKSRDYTINALALELKGKNGLDLRNLIDPCKGRDDLKRRIIRVISERNLISDPLRILRGISLASDLEFDIDKVTLELLHKHSSLLISSAGERISEELFKILKNKFSYRFFELMDRLEILDNIFFGWRELRKPDPGPYHHLRVDLHSLESLKQLELLLEKLQEERLSEYLKEEVREDRRRLEILKLATLLHDIGKAPAYHIDEEGKIKFTGHEKIGKDIARKIALRLKLSKKENQMLSDMIYYHLRPGFLVDCMQESSRAVFRYFRDTAEEALAVILLSIADKEATRGKLATEEDIKNHRQLLLQLVQDYFRKKEEIKPPKLIDGYDVMNILNISPSPKVGEILKQVEEAQAEKKIVTREDALGYIKIIFEELSRNVEK